MNSNDKIEQAKSLLGEGTCFAAVIPKENGEEEIYVSGKKGIAPIMEKLAISRTYFAGASVADRFLGKAAAMLLIDAGAVAVYGQTISSHAQKVLQQAEAEKEGQFSWSFERVVPYIINRAGDGMCPMEQAVLELTNPEEAYEILKNTLANMQRRLPK